MKSVNNSSTYKFGLKLKKSDVTSLCVNHYLCVSVYHFIQDQSCLPLPLSPKEKRALRMYLSVFRTSLFFVSLYVLLLLLLLN